MLGWSGTASTAALPTLASLVHRHPRSASLPFPSCDFNDATSYGPWLTTQAICLPALKQSRLIADGSGLQSDIAKILASESWARFFVLDGAASANAFKIFFRKLATEGSVFHSVTSTPTKGHD